MNVKKVNNTTNSKSIKMNNKVPPLMAEEVKAAVKKLAERAEREVPQNLTFSPVKEIIKDVENKFQVEEFIIKIIADPVNVKDSRRVMLSAYVPNTDYTAEISLIKGSKTEIIKEISNENFAKNISEYLEQISQAVKEFEPR